MQTGWTFAFAFEQIELSLIFMLLIWASLMALLYWQYYLPKQSWLLDFWLLEFPFAIHAGWITAASAVNVNVVVVNSTSMDTVVDNAAAIQLAVAIISLAVLHAISVWVLFGVRVPNYTIAAVLSWANGWIGNELADPEPSILERFDAFTIEGVRYAALAVSYIILGQLLGRAIWTIYRAFVVGLSKRYQDSN